MHQVMGIVLQIPGGGIEMLKPGLSAAEGIRIGSVLQARVGYHSVLEIGAGILRIRVNAGLRRDKDDAVAVRAVPGSHIQRIRRSWNARRHIRWQLRGGWE